MGVGELLGSVRDTDVLIDRIEELATTRGLEPTAVSAIAKELEGDRGRRHAELMDGLGSRRYFQLVNVWSSPRRPPLGRTASSPTSTSSWSPSDSG
jgi:hypothetical protein